ncbi:sigma-54 interaction domain-containing protein [Brevibacillus sp. B_LB10_24]|uniref:sigma-54 interaction domain-containing protein n=1 Tax=Brevibacillus sp. B_LB10_24 TaxID=3380645 RepID=UPI0038B712FA
MDISKALPTTAQVLEDQNQPLVVHSEAMKKVLRLCRKAAAVDSTVLLHGETGTGKSVLAQFIHRFSSRRKQPFLTINCSAIPENLLEAELFGYSPGAFTGALKQGKIGLIEAANHGTLFLDEIGELPLHLQPKLLHFLSHREYIPLGRREPRKADVRIVTATNCDLQEMVQKKLFREDLYYRLHVLDIKIPPLREREADLLPLIHFFLDKYNRQFGSFHRISDQALKLLLSFPWPGNIRQLENLLEKLIVTSDPLIDVPDLPDAIRCCGHTPQERTLLPSLASAMTEVERKMICESYQRFKSSRKVAEYLKISQSKASRLIRKYCRHDEDEIRT